MFSADEKRRHLYGEVALLFSTRQPPPPSPPSIHSFASRLHNGRITLKYIDCPSLNRWLTYLYSVTISRPFLMVTDIIYLYNCTPRMLFMITVESTGYETPASKNQPAACAQYTHTPRDSWLDCRCFGINHKLVGCATFALRKI